MGVANSNPIFPAKIRTVVMGRYPNVVIGENQFLFGAGEQGSRIDKLCASSTAAEPISYELHIVGSELGTESFPIAFGSIPAGAGYAQPIHNLMPADLADQDGRLFLAGPYNNANFGGKLLIRFLSQIPAGSVVTTLVMANDY